MPAYKKSSLHIKRRTAGTSNELSLDVLDAKKDRADSSSQVRTSLTLDFSPLGRDSVAGKKSDRDEGAGKVSLSRSPGAHVGIASSDAGDASRTLPYDDPEAEIRKRKKTRKRRRIVFATLAAIVLVILGYLAVTELSRYFSDQQAHLDLLEEAIGVIEDTDETVVALDEIVLGTIDDETAEEIGVLTDDIETVESELEDGKAKAAKAGAGLSSESDRDAADQVVKSIDARLTMLEQATVLLEADLAAKQAAEDIEAAWSLLLAADALAEDAAVLVEDTTDENVNASIGKSEEAIEAFENAYEAFEQVAEEYPAADLSDYSEYIELRIEAQEAAIRSDGHILLQDSASAAEENDAMYELDSKAAAIAQDFPESPAEPILEAYEAETEDAREAYETAREKAATADSRIRSYLGED